MITCLKSALGVKTVCHLVLRLVPFLTSCFPFGYKQVKRNTNCSTLVAKSNTTSCVLSSIKEWLHLLRTTQHKHKQKQDL